MKSLNEVNKYRVIILPLNMAFTLRMVNNVLLSEPLEEDEDVYVGVKVDNVPEKVRNFISDILDDYIQQKGSVPI